VAVRDQMIGRPPHRLAIVGRDHVRRSVEHGGAHAHVAAPDLRAQLRDAVVLADRRHQQDAEQALPLQEMPQIVQHGRRTAVERAHHHLELGAVQRLQHALLDVHHRLRAGVVVDEADQEVAPQRERARLRIGNVAEAADHLLDPPPRLFAQQRRAVDHPADRLLRHAGDPGDIIDRGLTALAHRPTLARLPRADQPCARRLLRASPDTGFRPDPQITARG
jgi:hypothetical protein